MLYLNLMCKDIKKLIFYWVECWFKCVEVWPWAQSGVGFGQNSGVGLGKC